MILNIISNIQKAGTELKRWHIKSNNPLFQGSWSWDVQPVGLEEPVEILEDDSSSELSIGVESMTRWWPKKCIIL